MARKKRSDQQSFNRVQPILSNIRGTENSDTIMELLENALKGSERDAPIPSRAYVYSYYAKTPNLLYDQYPITVVNSVYDWGFVGYNLHLKMVRQYDWNQCATKFYELRTPEVQTALTLPLKFLVQN